MKPERGALVSGSDPPSGRSVHNTAGDTWRALARRLIQTRRPRVWQKQETKILDPSPMAKSRSFFRFGRRAKDAEGPLSPPRPWIHLISPRPSSTFNGLARHEAGWPWVASMSRSKVYRRVSCLRSACSFFPVAVVREYLQPIFLVIVWKQNFATSCFH